jgi:hypothetical protein
MEMGKVEASIWICGIIFVLWLVLYSVGAFAPIVSLFSHIFFPPPSVVAPAAQSTSG